MNDKTQTQGGDPLGNLLVAQACAEPATAVAAPPARWRARPWARCATHGPEEIAAWGCPHCVAELRRDNERMREALQRLADWGGLPGGARYSGSVAAEVMDWFRGGMAGPLPPLADWAGPARPGTPGSAAAAEPQPDDDLAVAGGEGAAPQLVSEGSACPRRGCDGRMVAGTALQQTLSPGAPDFPGDDGPDAVVTMSPGGPGRLVACWKCAVCGHSVSKGAD